MRHLTSGGFYKLFLRVLFLCALLLWTFFLLGTPRDNGDGPAGGLELLSFSKLTSGDDAEKLDHLEAAYRREREERQELERSIEQLLTKQQDLQGQLDILRQQIPLPEDTVEGAAPPPDIGYTKWAKNYYNTRRTGPEEGNSEGDVLDTHKLSIELPGLEAPKAVVNTSKKPLTTGIEMSEGGKCTLPKEMDYTKNFWGNPFAGCCKGLNCGRYELRDKGQSFVSKCGAEASVDWGEGKQTLAPGESIRLSSQAKAKQYLIFVCNGVEELVAVPTTNEQAHQRARASATSSSKTKPNVVVMMIDALSRAQFIRALPNTLQLFDRLASDPDQPVSVFDFQFFGTLGAYSPPNRYAFFSGYPFTDDQAFFDGTPFPKEQKVLRVHDRNGVWMWDVLKELGYMTYSARDMCSRTAAFVYDDFISRPWTDVHFQDLFCNFGYKSHAASTEHCLKTRYAHQYVLESGSLFHETHSDVPRFTYLDFAEGHEPSMTQVRTMDDDLVAHLQRFLADENTIVVLASDHGIGYGKQHVTRDGPIEERLPALYVLAPNKLLTEKSQRNLADNTQKLVTGLDVFETVMDVTGGAGKRPWAHSLLRPMASRTCKEAGINVHACPCSLWDGSVASRIAWKR